MPLSQQNIRLARTILSDPGNITAINWWHRDDIENHIDRPLTDDEWEKVRSQIEAQATPQFEDVTYALEIVGIN